MVRNRLLSSLPVLAAIALLATHPFRAHAGTELDAAQAKKLFNDRGCNACHGAEDQRIGPPYQVVAMRYSSEYAADPGALIEKLATKIRYGGAGAWGYVPMVSNPAVSQAEAESISRWIMGLKPPAPR
jgi:cytochrome c